MQLDLLDLTPQYLQYGLHQRQEDYFATYPALFRHYYRYWAENGELVSLTQDAVREKVTLVESRLPEIERAFTRQGFLDKVQVALFVGANTTNGHVFWDQPRRSFVVWLPVEAYASPLQVDVFVTHEIVHGLHYARCPEFHFQDEQTKHLVGRQVITEGTATWGTQVILGHDEKTALWADYLSPVFVRQWYARCRAREPEMARRILQEWSESSKDNAWFGLWDKNDVTRYRGGYYVGLQVIRKIHQSQKLDLQSLCSFEKQTLETIALGVLKGMAEGTNHRGG